MRARAALGSTTLNQWVPGSSPVLRNLDIKTCKHEGRFCGHFLRVVVSDFRSLRGDIVSEAFSACQSPAAKIPFLAAGWRNAIATTAKVQVSRVLARSLYQVGSGSTCSVERASYTCANLSCLLCRGLQLRLKVFDLDAEGLLKNARVVAEVMSAECHVITRTTGRRACRISTASSSPSSRTDRPRSLPSSPAS